MKQADVKIGGEYLTKVSGGLVRVRVTAVVNQIVSLFSLSGPKKRMAFEIERVDAAPIGAHRKLTPRSAARLRPAPVRATMTASVESVSLKVTVES